jgi:hypothetical protein
MHRQNPARDRNQTTIVSLNNHDRLTLFISLGTIIGGHLVDADDRRALIDPNLPRDTPTWVTW